MSEPFVIRSSAGQAQISLDGNTLTISARGLEASRVVYEPEAGDTLRGVATLFDELARDWRGWDGERTWASLEGEATVTAVHDGLGTVELRVRLQKHESESWSAAAWISVDAGALDSLAREARSAA